MITARKVLVIEDDRMHVSAYKAKLTKAGFEFRIALDSEEADKILDTFTPDLIVLDIVLPKKDGFAWLKEMKANDKLKHIPVIIASNLGQKEDIERGLQLGAERFLIKTEHSLDDIVHTMVAIIESKGN